MQTVKEDLMKDDTNKKIYRRRNQMTQTTNVCFSYYKDVSLNIQQTIEGSGVNLFLFLRSRGYAENQFEIQIYERILKFKSYELQIICHYTKF